MGKEMRHMDDYLHKCLVLAPNFCDSKKCPPINIERHLESNAIDEDKMSLADLPPHKHFLTKRANASSCNALEHMLVDTG